MKILIVAGLPDFLPEAAFDATVGVDAGARWLLDMELGLDVAVGDFDSVAAAELAQIEQAAGQLVKLPTQKDVTDLEATLALVQERFPADSALTVLGALGGRLDHELTNVYLPVTARFRAMAPRITLISRQNIVRYLLPGTHQLPRLAGKRYIGFLQTARERTLSITKGAKYPIPTASDNFADIYASNEFTADSMTVSVAQGALIVIYSGDL